MIVKTFCLDCAYEFADEYEVEECTRVTHLGTRHTPEETVTTCPSCGSDSIEDIEDWDY